TRSKRDWSSDVCSSDLGIAQRDEVALLDPLRLAGAVVLAHKAGAGSVEGGHHVVDQRVGVGGGRVAADHHRVEGVDAGLNEEVRSEERRVGKGWKCGGG